MSLRICFAGLLTMALADAQFFTFGVVGGASLTQDFTNTYSPIPPPVSLVLTDYSAPERYIFGAMVEFQLRKDWSVEVDGLYHPLRFDSATILANGALIGVSPSPVTTWEFPVLAKYRFRWGQWRPFIEAGPTFRTAGNLNGSNPSHHGVAAGLGIEARVGKFRISPEIRYIRWAEDSAQFNSFAAITRPDQLELLTSFSTAGFEGGQPFGSRIALGAVIGTTLTPDFRSFQFSNGQPGGFAFTRTSSPGAFLVGPAVEVAIAKGFFFEGDAFHQPMRETTQFSGSASSSTQSTSTWSFPLLGKYKFSTHGLKPFVEAGPEFRAARYLQGASPYGITAGVGIEKRVWRMAVAPSVRYTHWGNMSPNYLGNLVPFSNQVEMLAGVLF